MQIKITTILYCAPTTVIELPIENWDKIKNWHVKWDALYYTIDNEKWNKVPLHNNIFSTDAIDWNYQITTKIFNPETDELIAEDEE